VDVNEKLTKQINLPRNSITNNNEISLLKQHDYDLIRNVKTLYKLLNAFPLLKKDGQEKIDKIMTNNTENLQKLSRFQLLKIYVSLLKEYKKAVNALKAPIKSTPIINLISGQLINKQNTQDHSKGLKIIRKLEIKKKPTKLIEKQEKPLKPTKIDLYRLLRRMKRHSLLCETDLKKKKSDKRCRGLIIRNSNTIASKDISCKKLPSIVFEKKKSINHKYNLIIHNLKKRNAKNYVSESYENQKVEGWGDNDDSRIAYFDEFLEMTMSKFGHQDKRELYKL